MCIYLLRFYDFLLHPGRGAEYCDQSISLCVCLSANVSLEPLYRSSQNVFCRSPVALARPSFGSVTIRYVLPVLWMTSRLAIMGSMAMRGRLAALRYWGRVWCLRMLCLLLWPWLWPDDLDIRTWPRYSEDVPAYPARSFWVKAFNSYSTNRTDRHTDRQTDATKCSTTPHLVVVKLHFHLCSACCIDVHCCPWYSRSFLQNHFNPFNASYSKLLLFEGSSAILV